MNIKDEASKLADCLLFTPTVKKHKDVLINSSDALRMLVEQSDCSESYIMQYRMEVASLKRKIAQLGKGDYLEGWEEGYTACKNDIAKENNSRVSCSNKTPDILPYLSKKDLDDRLFRLMCDKLTWELKEGSLTTPTQIGIEARRRILGEK